MITLLIVGPAVEVMLGKARFLALYLLAGLGGNVVSYLFAPLDGVSAGASGAIFGVMGAYVVLARLQRKPLGPVVALIVINLVIGLHRQHRLAGPPGRARHRCGPRVRLPLRLDGPADGQRDRPVRGGVCHNPRRPGPRAPQRRPGPRQRVLTRPAPGHVNVLTASPAPLGPPRSARTGSARLRPRTASRAATLRPAPACAGA